MKRTFAMLVLAPAAIFLSGCQTTYEISVSAPPYAPPASAVHARLDAFLVLIGFSSVPIPSQGGEWVGHWRRVDNSKSFLYGQAQLEVVEYFHAGTTFIYVCEYNGAGGLDRQLVSDIEKELGKLSPKFTILLNQTDWYAPSFGWGMK